MDLPHLFVEKFTEAESYSGSGRGNFLRHPFSPQQRRNHASHLRNQLASISFEHPADYYSEDEPGVYVEARSFPGFEIYLESLDTRHSRLCSVTTNEDNSQSAVIFIFDRYRDAFLSKLDRYLAQETKHTHSKLFDNIASLRLANLNSLWTSSQEDFPDNHTQLVWWEVWLIRKSLDRLELSQFVSYCRDNGIVTSRGIQKFEQYSVLAVQSSREQLESALVLISCLAELRKVVDTGHFLLEEEPLEQRDWAEEILNRTTFDTDVPTSVLILDTGVNFNHVLITDSTNSDWCMSWDDDWPKYDTNNPHGTMQAGLVIFGDFQDQISSTDPVAVNFKIESCRILPPNDVNDKFLFGALTYFGVSSAELRDDSLNRIVSIAITADHDGITGQPTAWSSEIDMLHFDGEGKRLFVTSTGNIRGNEISAEYRNNVKSHSIEDPAQAWNAITVGSYTTKRDVVEPDFMGWEALALVGDISPTSRSSVNWGWVKEAPYKPDVVEEGGNLLYEPQSGGLTNADCVSLVTTGEPTRGTLFTDHRESSASNALCTRLAAKLWSLYPDYRAETIRALIVHSAEWNTVMSGYVEEARLHGYTLSEANEVALRMFGHGVPSDQIATFSSEYRTTLIVEEELLPYRLDNGDLSLNEMHLVELPWPVDTLTELGAASVSAKVTLSYFIEPNPGRRAYASRFRYQSFGLRFKLILPNEDLEEFKQRISVPDRDESYTEPSDDDRQGWLLGSNLRTRGSIHQDVWRGTATELASRNYIAIYPVAGWWKQRQSKLFASKSDFSVPYSLVVSLHLEGQEIDIYEQISDIIETRIAIENEITVEIE